MIDLRSDTVRPSPEVRRAMAEAEVGDELFGECPATRALEAYAAELLGKEAALFLPTGTMANAAAVLAHRRPPDRVLMDAQGHIRRREMAAPAALAHLRPSLFDTPDGCPDPDDVAYWCSRAGGASLVCLETTHTWRRGLAVRLERLRAVAEAARPHGGAVHLDGARLFHAAVALNVKPRTIAATADSVAISLYKGLGAPAGAVLAGPTAFIAAARELRLALGGTMRQPGPFAAAGLAALRAGWGHLARDHAAARRLAVALAAFEPLNVRPGAVESNAVVFDPAPLGIDGAEFARRAAEAGVRVGWLAPRRVRLMTHRDLSDADLDEAITALTRVVRGCLP